jgi:hypothetical protein
VRLGNSQVGGSATITGVRGLVELHPRRRRGGALSGGPYVRGFVCPRAEIRVLSIN